MGWKDAVGLASKYVFSCLAPQTLPFRLFPAQRDGHTAEFRRLTPQTAAHSAVEDYYGGLVLGAPNRQSHFSRAEQQKRLANLIQSNELAEKHVLAGVKKQVEAGEITASLRRRIQLLESQLAAKDLLLNEERERVQALRLLTQEQEREKLQHIKVIGICLVSNCKRNGGDAVLSGFAAYSAAYERGK